MFYMIMYKEKSEDKKISVFQTERDVKVTVKVCNYNGYDM